MIYANFLFQIAYNFDGSSYFAVIMIYVLWWYDNDGDDDITMMMMMISYWAWWSMEACTRPVEKENRDEQSNENSFIYYEEYQIILTA